MGRYHRYQRYHGSGMGFSVFVVIIILAVAAGYAGTKYIVYPYLLDSSTQAEDASDKSNTEKTATDAGVDVIASMPSVIIDQQDIKDVKENKEDKVNGSAALNTNTAVGSSGPFCVQFGSFTTKDGAEVLSKDLTAKGIYSYVYESGGAYKVLGLPYQSQDKAKEAASVVSQSVADVFVVDLSTLIH